MGKESFYSDSRPRVGRDFDLTRSEPVTLPGIVAVTDAPSSPLPTGRKDDSGKVRMELLADVSKGIKGVAEVMTWAVTDKKPVAYRPGSWQGVPDFYNRYMGALMRHLSNIHENGIYAIDAETRLLDLKHLATDALFLAEMAQRDIESGKAVLGEKVLKGVSQ